MSPLRANGTAFAPITADEVQARGPLLEAKYSADAELKIVVQSAQIAESWLAQEQWKLLWRETDVLYQSPRTQSVFEGSSTPRSNVNRFTVAKHTNSLVPMMMSGIFYDPTPFLIRAIGKTKVSTVRAKTSLFSALIRKAEAKDECEPGIESQVLNGTGVWQKILEKREKYKTHYVRKTSAAKLSMPLTGEEEVHTEESDEFEAVETIVTETVPVLEYCPLGTIFVDPKWNRANRIGKAAYVVKRRYLNFQNLNELRGKPGYTIPPEDELKAIFFPAQKEQPQGEGIVKEQQFASATVHHAESKDEMTAADPLEGELKVDEYWSQTRVIAVLQDKVKIRSEEHHMGDNSFLSANFWNIQNAGYGIGVGRLSGADQRIEQGSINAALDILAYAVNQQYVVSRGANVFTQQLRSRLGGFVMVDGDASKGITTLETPKVPPELWHLYHRRGRSLLAGKLAQRGGSSIGRTATGAGGIMAANAGRIQGPVGRFVDHVFIPSWNTWMRWCGADAHQ
jgi:hypothetical protein